MSQHDPAAAGRGRDPRGAAGAVRVCPARWSLQLHPGVAGASCLPPELATLAALALQLSITDDGRTVSPSTPVGLGVSEDHKTDK